jgi:hypothetical protein
MQGLRMKRFASFPLIARRKVNANEDVHGRDRIVCEALLTEVNEQFAEGPFTK